MSNHSPFTIHHSLFLLLLGLLLASLSPALAQQPPTPTPNTEGNIYVIVQANDSLWAIAARAGISLAELLALNNLTEDAIITPGQRLLVGQGPPPVTPTIPVPPTLTPTKPPPPPSATAVPPPRTALCLQAFADLNRNGVHDAGEPFKAAVAFTVFNDREVVGNYVTDGISEPYCLENLTAGEYKITRSVRKDETLTTEGDWTIILAPGNVVEMVFGSYTAVTPTPVTPPAIRAATPEPPSAQTSEVVENGRPNSIFIGASLVVIFLLAGWLFNRRLNQK